MFIVTRIPRTNFSKIKLYENIRPTAVQIFAFEPFGQNLSALRLFIDFYHQQDLRQFGGINWRPSSYGVHQEYERHKAGTYVPSVGCTGHMVERRMVIGMGCIDMAR